MISMLRMVGNIVVACFVLMAPAAGVDKLPATLQPAEFSLPKLEAVHHFATLINDSEELARNCRIEIERKHGLSLSFWTTNQTDKQHTGAHNESADVWPGSAQSFSFVLRAIAKPAVLAGTVIATFVCDVHQSPVVIQGVNNIRLESFDFSGLPRLGDGKPNLSSYATEESVTEEGATELKAAARSITRLWL